MLRNTKKVPEKEKKPAISYWQKDKTLCPVCGKGFEREVMHSGSGRMIAGELTDELHRLFEPSAKYGTIYPLIYDIGACPNCHAAFFWKDFAISDKASVQAIYDSEEERRSIVNNVFPYYNLKKERSLYDGCAMYFLALLTYDKVAVSHSPTMKRAMLSLRLAWLCKDLDTAVPGHNFSFLAESFYRKALFFYQQTLLNETGRVETIASVSNFGPDMDKNYGYDGVVYLCGLLEYKYGQRDDEQQRFKKLDEYKRAIARIFGLGKSSKEKPGPLLEHSRNLYDRLSKELANANMPDIEDFEE